LVIDGVTAEPIRSPLRLSVPQFVCTQAHGGGFDGSQDRAVTLEQAAAFVIPQGLGVDPGLCGDLARSHPTSMNPVPKYRVKPASTRRRFHISGVTPLPTSASARRLELPFVVVVVDCRPVERRRPDDVAKFDAVARACALVGWEPTPCKSLSLHDSSPCQHRHRQYRQRPVHSACGGACSAHGAVPPR
jgi:hypothetical protein